MGKIFCRLLGEESSVRFDLGLRFLHLLLLVVLGLSFSFFDCLGKGCIGFGISGLQVPLLEKNAETSIVDSRRYDDGAVFSPCRVTGSELKQFAASGYLQFTSKAM